MNKLGLVTLVLIIGVFLVMMCGMASFEGQFSTERKDMSRIVTFDKLYQETQYFLQNYWALGLIIQALAVITVGAGLSMAIRGEEK